MLTHSKRLPRYLQLAERLKQYIESDALPPGQQLPSQRDLAERFDTTLMTIRKALSVLEEEGLIRTEHGVGTFVVDPLLDEDHLQLLSLSQTIEQQPALKARAETEVVTADSQYVDANAARLLGQDQVGAIGLLVRRRLLAGQPFLYQRSFLSGPFASLVKRYRSGMSLYALLQQEMGTAVTMGKEVLQPIVLDEGLGKQLACAAGQPAWLSMRLATNADGHPIVYDEVVLLPDRVVLTIDHLGKRSTSQLNLVTDERFDFFKYLNREG